MAAMTLPPTPPVITDAAERQRFEAHVDGELAGMLEYIVKYGRIALIHTEVSPTSRGAAWRPPSRGTRSTTPAGATCASSWTAPTSRST